MTPARLETAIRDLASQIHGAGEDAVHSPARLFAIAMRLNELAPQVGVLRSAPIEPLTSPAVLDLNAERARRLSVGARTR